MHVGLIVDQERLAHEGALVGRLVTAFLDRGMRVTRFLPREAPEPDPPVDALRVDVNFDSALWMHGHRARALAHAIDRSIPDVLFAIGRSAWAVGMQLAAEIERPVALDVWSAALARVVPRGRNAHHVGAYVAPTHALARVLETRVDPALVAFVPPGVVLPPPPAPRSSRIALQSLAAIGSGRNLDWYSSLLRGLARMVTDVPALQIALELRGPREHDVWREAHRLELLHNISAIRDAAPLRDLITQCDVLVIAEPIGAMRSVILEALAHGMAVVAARDDELGLIDEHIGWIVESPDADRWTTALEATVESPERAWKRGLEARSRVAEQHRPVHQAGALESVFERMIDGESLAFEPNSTGS